MPVRFAFAASQVLAPRLLATASAQWTGWSTNTNFAAPGTASKRHRSARRKPGKSGGGLEWEAAFAAGPEFSRCASASGTAQLPFTRRIRSRCRRDSAAKEFWPSRARCLGLRLASQTILGPLAVADLSVERGKRSGWDGAFTGGSTGDLLENPACPSTSFGPLSLHVGPATLETPPRMHDRSKPTLETYRLSDVPLPRRAHAQRLAARRATRSRRARPRGCHPGEYTCAIASTQSNA